MKETAKERKRLHEDQSKEHVANAWAIPENKKTKNQRSLS
jgi:hypothetical protein